MEDPQGGLSALDPDSPQAAAVAWVEAVMDRGDLRAAWAMTDPTLRLVLAQEWVWSNRHTPLLGYRTDWRDVAEGLASSPSEHPLWERFAADRIREWHTVWKGFGARTWMALDRAEVVGVDLEIVSFVEPGAASTHGRGGRMAFARRLLLRHTGTGWLVAGLDGARLFRPGWPPSPE